MKSIVCRNRRNSRYSRQLMRCPTCEKLVPEAGVYIVCWYCDWFWFWFMLHIQWSPRDTAVIRHKMDFYKPKLKQNRKTRNLTRPHGRNKKWKWKKINLEPKRLVTAKKKLDETTRQKKKMKKKKNLNQNKQNEKQHIPITLDFNVVRLGVNSTVFIRFMNFVAYDSITFSRLRVQ